MNIEKVIIEHAALLIGVIRPGQSLSEECLHAAQLEFAGVISLYAIDLSQLTEAGQCAVSELLALRLARLFTVKPKVGDATPAFYEVADLHDRPPFETFKRPTCRGCYALGTACGDCEKCLWERHRVT